MFYLKNPPFAGIIVILHLKNPNVKIKLGKKGKIALLGLLWYDNSALKSLYD